MDKKEKKPWIEFTKEQRDAMLPKLQKFVEEEYELELGNLGAAQLLNHITDTIGPFYYNKGVEDAIGFLDERMGDMYLLMKE